MLSRQSGSSTPRGKVAHHWHLPHAGRLYRNHGTAQSATPYDPQAMSHFDRPTLHHETPALIAALSYSALRHASSTAIFQRGRAYASCGAVWVLSAESVNTPAIYAEVTGTDTYAA